MALVLCVGLAVPAMAISDADLYIITSDNKEHGLEHGFPKSGEGWNWDGEKLTLNGFSGWGISSEIWDKNLEAEIKETVVLADGSVNTMERVDLGGAITFAGSGELIIYAPLRGEDAAYHNFCFSPNGILNFSDGLVMTGGANEGDSFALQINSEGLPVTGTGTVAEYIRISQKGSKDSASTPPASTPKFSDFKDLSRDAYYAEAISWAIAKGVTTGVTANAFEPNSACTKAQILTFMWRACKSPAASGSNSFSDVKKSDYYYTAASWAKRKNLVSGSVFDGSAPCTRSMTVMYLWTLAGRPKPSGSVSFTDVRQNADYADAVAWAVENKITSGSGDGTTFSPDAVCTRAQIATFLYRFFVLSGIGMKFEYE